VLGPFSVNFTRVLIHAMKNSKGLWYFFHFHRMTNWYSHVKKKTFLNGGHLGFPKFLKKNRYENFSFTGIHGQTCKLWKTTIIFIISTLFIQQNNKNNKKTKSARSTQIACHACHNACKRCWNACRQLIVP
jgi:hypothetical protein